VALRRLGCAFALFFCACTTLRKGEWEVLGASPAPSSGFLAEPERLDDASGPAAFSRSWTSPQHDWRRFSKLYIPPVDTSHVLPESLWDSLNVRHFQVSADVVVQADELHRRLEDAFRGDPYRHFEVIDDPDGVDDDTVVLQVSLVELVPNKAVLGAMGLAAWGGPLEIGIPVATLTAFVAHGSIAMESQLCTRDGTVLAMYADRDTGRMRIIDLRSLTWYANAHEAMDEWAEALVDLANTPMESEVKHKWWFTPLPW